jgi:hypothetical protein
MAEGVLLVIALALLLGVGLAAWGVLNAGDDDDVY